MEQKKDIYASTEAYLRKLFDEHIAEKAMSMVVYHMKKNRTEWDQDYMRHLCGSKRATGSYRELQMISIALDLVVKEEIREQKIMVMERIATALEKLATRQ